MPASLKPNFSELGRSGLSYSSGYIQEEFLRELSGSRWRKVVKEMLWNDAVIASMFFAIEMLMRQVTWDVTPVSESSEDQETADFVSASLYGMDQPWKETLSEILSFLPWGWSLHEKVFKRREDGKIVWAKWASRSQDSLQRWELDANGYPVAMIQAAPPNYNDVAIPIEKSILFRTSSQKGNPEGQSMLRAVYRSWYFKQNIENIEGIGIERDLAGLPYATAPAEYLSATDGAKKTVTDEIKKIVTGVRNNDQGAAIFPSDVWEGSSTPMFEFKLLSSGGTRNFDTNKIIQRYDQRILMRLMADFMVLGHEKVGSFALSSNKTNMFSLAIGAWLDLICETINREHIPELLRLNGIQSPAPKLTHGDIESIDLVELGDFIAKLSGAHVSLTPEILGYALGEAGFPVPEDEVLEAMLQQPQPIIDPPLGSQLEMSEPDLIEKQKMKKSWIKHAPKQARKLYR